MKQQTALVQVDPHRVAQLDTIAKEIHALSQTEADSPFTAGIQMAVAVSTLRELLTPEMMEPIMSLQGTKLGFLTDKDTKKIKTERGWERVKAEGYPVDTVKDTLIEATARGARMVGNEVNIIGGNCYLTKNYFFRLLDDRLGRDHWNISHGLPQVVTKGEGRDAKVAATVQTVITWTEKGKENSHKLVRAIKGDAYASADSYTGKADRKAAAWLLGQITGERYDEGDLEDDDAIEVAATVSPAAEAPVAQSEDQNKPASPMAIEWLKILISQPSLVDDVLSVDVAQEIGLHESGEQPMPYHRANVLQKRLVTLLRKSGADIPAMPTEKPSASQETASSG